MAATLVEDRPVMARVERWLGQHPLVIVALGALVATVYIAGPLVFPRPGRFINWLDISAVLTITTAFAMAMRVPWRSERTLAQLADRRVIVLPADKLDDLQRAARARGARSARRGLLIGAALILIQVISFLAQAAPTVVQDFAAHDAADAALGMLNAALVVPATFLIGVLAGYYIGYAFSVGRWASLLREQGVALRVRPGHPDGAAGWGPLGGLYLFQALSLAIPALYYGVWSYLITANVDQSHSRFHVLQTPYLVFFIVALAAEVFAFLAPIWSFHVDMRRQKAALTPETDALSDRILTLQARAVETDNPEEASNLSQQVAAMSSFYTARAKMSTWPLETGVTIRFLLANLGLLAPLVAQFVQFRLPL
jgi:hypothetical protein